MNKLGFQIFFIFILSFKIFASGRLADRHINDFLEENGINEDYSTSSLQHLITTLQMMKADPLYKKDGPQLFLDYALKLASKIDRYKNSEDKEMAFTLAKRIIFTVRANEINQGGIPPFKDLFSIPFQLRSSIPYLNLSDRNNILGDDAENEANFLTSPSLPQRYVSKDEMRKMSAWQISKLDVKMGHPAWRSKIEMSHDKSDYWKKLENWNENEIWRNYKNKDGQNVEKYKIEKYKIEKARRVLMIDKIKDSATAPKITAVDSYGEKWKVKWGLEIQTTALASRLYIKLGGRYADLSYANSKGRNQLILVLEDPKKTGNCEAINSYSLLRHCLLISHYKFDIEYYTLEKGLITENNFNEVLFNLAQSGSKNFSKKSLIGRTYLVFKESLVELQSKNTQERGGPSSTDVIGATRDRVARSMMLFDMWIWNYDAKDDNNRSAIVHNFYPGVEKYFVEYPHDLGASLGSLGKSGLINYLKEGERFARYSKIKHSKIIFKQLVLYRPKAWAKITYADGLWMAEKIAGISNRDLRIIAQESHWPDFLQEAFIRKMAVRRDQIATLFNLYIEDPKKDYIKNFGVDLSTSQLREKWATHYQINPQTLENILLKNKKINSQGSKKYIDWPMIEGKISSCKESVIINLIEKTSIPTGISRRVTRMKDDTGLPPCLFKGI